MSDIEKVQALIAEARKASLARESSGYGRDSGFMAGQAFAAREHNFSKPECDFFNFDTVAASETAAARLLVAETMFRFDNSAAPSVQWADRARDHAHYLRAADAVIAALLLAQFDIRVSETKEGPSV